MKPLASQNTSGVITGAETTGEVVICAADGEEVVVVAAEDTIEMVVVIMEAVVSLDFTVCVILFKFHDLCCYSHIIFV